MNALGLTEITKMNKLKITAPVPFHGRLETQGTQFVVTNCVDAPFETRLPRQIHIAIEVGSIRSTPWLNNLHGEIVKCERNGDDWRVAPLPKGGVCKAEGRQW